MNKIKIIWHSIKYLFKWETDPVEEQTKQSDVIPVWSTSNRRARRKAVFDEAKRKWNKSSKLTRFRQ